MLTRLPIFLLVLLILPASTSDAKVSIEKTSIAKQPAGTLVYADSAILSPDRRHIAYVAVSDEGMQVCVDMDYGKRYDHIAKGYPVFSPEGNQIAYLADREGKHFAVVGQREYPGYDGACCLAFSPDGRHTAYIAQDKDKQLVVLNGRRMKTYDMIDRMIGVKFSPDSEKVAYIARNITENSVRLVLNGKESPPFDSIDKILFSPDSKTLAYIVSEDKQQFVVRGDLQEGPYDKAEGLTWGPGSSQLAYIVIKNGEFRVVNNGREHYAGDFSPQTVFFEQGGYATRVQKVIPPIFSPDASQMAFMRTEKDKFQIVIGETAGPSFDVVSPIVFSPDAKQFAYVGASRMSAGMKMQVVHNQTRSLFYDEINVPVFSPDATHIAYQVKEKDQWLMMLDGKSQKPYDAVGMPAFSPDSRILAYSAIKGKNAIMVVNGKEEIYPIGKPSSSNTNMFGGPCFSPDSRHYAYLVWEKKQRFLLIVDGALAQEFDGFFFDADPTPIIFDTENQARCLIGSVKNDNIEIVRIDIRIE